MKNKGRITGRRLARRLYRGNKLLLAVTLTTTVLSGAVSVIFAYIIQQIVDTISGAQGALPLRDIVIKTAALIAGTVVVCAIDSWFAPRFYARAMSGYKNYAFERLTEKSISSFSDESTSLYISALSNDANTIEQNYLKSLPALAVNLVWLIGSFTLMMIYSPQLTLIALGAILLPIIASIVTGSRLAPAEERVSKRNEGFVASLKDALTGFTVIKSFKAEGEVTALFRRVTDDTEKEKCRRGRIANLVENIGMLSGIIAQMAVFLAGAYLAASGKGVTAGIVMAFVQLMGLATSPIAKIPGLIAGRRAARKLINKLADAISENVRDEGEDVAPVLNDAIEVKNLSFSYEENKPVLDGLNARFEAGRSYAIVGGSGSGKSTLLNLLMAGHSGYSGEIIYDQTELHDISSRSLYDIVSLVQQNVFIFNNSIRDNITMFREFENEAVDSAIRMSGLSSLVAERGEDYACGENGAGLSGGERQRVSIARALLRKTPVLLVDEATAALDAQTAYHVSDSILDLEGLMRIVVTHALEESLLRRYDGILVLRNGRVAESGAFDELMAQKGYFYSLFTVSQ